MTSPTRRAGAAAGLTAACLVSVAHAPVAGAQNVIPGDTNPGTTVVTALSGVTVTVTQPDLAHVVVTMTNASGTSLDCSGPDGTSTTGGTVTTAEVARSSLAYYAAHPFKPDPSPTFGSTAAGNTIGANVPLAPVLGFLPTGSIAPVLGDAYADRDALATAHAKAVQGGHAGTMPTFTVARGATYSRTVTLGPPSTGGRTDFVAGVFLVCRDTSGRPYAFAGYEGGAEPTGPLLRSGSSA